MSNTLLSPLPSLRLSDNDIPPATATHCQWHLQPRPRPPKPQILQHAGTRPTAARQPKSPTPLPIQACSSVRERSSRAEPRLKSPSTDTAAGAYSPRGFLLRGFSDACLRAAPRAVTGRHPKTLNVTGRSSDGGNRRCWPIAPFAGATVIVLINNLWWPCRSRYDPPGRSVPTRSANERDARQHISQSRAADSRSRTSACRSAGATDRHRRGLAGHQLLAG